MLKAERMERECQQGKIEGTRARGRQRITFMDALLKELEDGQTVMDLVTLDDDRQRRRFIVFSVT